MLFFAEAWSIAPEDVKKIPFSRRRRMVDEKVRMEKSRPKGRGATVARKPRRLR